MCFPRNLALIFQTIITHLLAFSIECSRELPKRFCAFTFPLEQINELSGKGANKGLRVP